MEKTESLAEDMRAIAALPDMKFSAVIVSAVGMVRNAKLGYGRYAKPEVSYDEMLVAEPAEVLALSGFILKDEQPPFHLHGVLGTASFGAVGGHVFDAEVVTFVELCLRLSGAPIRRKTKDGLAEMFFPE